MSSLKDLAQQTLRIVDAGEYVSPAGRTVRIASEVAAAAAGTILVRPGESASYVFDKYEGRGRVEVTEETTAQAARRLVQYEGLTHVAALNFASAKNPGGGFLGGARAQEEDLARASALYKCVCTQPAYYDVHRASPSMIYSDHLIYSPAVPFFRDDTLALLEAPFVVSILTSAAPNAGEALRRDPHAKEAIADALEARARVVLEVAARHAHRVLVLGAWGCGVFRNDPEVVAGVFARALEEARFKGLFERIVFAVYDRSPARANLAAFRARFGG